MGPCPSTPRTSFNIRTSLHRKKLTSYTVIPIEYMSDFLVGPPLLNPNLSGSRSSGADQRTVYPPSVVDVLVVTVFELRSPATLISPTSVKRARPSSEIRMFAYVKLSAVVCSEFQEPHPFQIAVGEFHAVEILKAECSVL